MEKLFLFRHALYENDYNYDDPKLSERGKIQAKELAENIEANLNGDNKDITIWTSPAIRAKETALIIKEKFPTAAYVEYEKLWADRDHRCDFDWLENQLNNFQGEILIIISHLKYVCDFPKRLGFDNINVGCAGGILVENENYTYFNN